MFERFSRSWQLFKSSVAVLKEDHELLLFPVLSSVAALLVMGSFLAPVAWWFVTHEEVARGDEAPAAFYALLLAFYIVQYFVIFFFNTALVGAAMIRLEGGDPTVRDGLRIARERVGAIFGYALIASTVGMILAAIEERVGIVGKIIVGLLGASWTVASFLVVPVLVSRDIGPVDAVKDSVRLLKKTWGENIIGNVGFGAVFGVAYFVIVALMLLIALPLASVPESGLGLESQGALIAVIVTGVLALLLLAVVQAALKGIYSAALYRHATGKEISVGFSPQLLDSAFKPR